MSDKKKIYFNASQLEFINVGAHTGVSIASRGFGKSEGIDAAILLRNVQAMPRSTIALLSPTFKKALQNTLPAVCAGLARLGYYRNYHYFIGRKAPEAMNFAKPLYEPLNWENYIHWYNGTVCAIGSFDTLMSFNSKTLDSILGFEAKFLDIRKIRDEVYPANRGNINHFGNCPWHHGIHYSTDMPTNKSGEWLFEFEKIMNKDMIKFIKQLYYDREQYKLKNTGTDYMAKKIKEHTDDITKLRRKAVFYAEYSAIDNIDILGEQWLREQKRNLPPITFLTSILNKRITKLENGFYSAFNDNVHTYEAPNLNVLKSAYDYDKFKGTDCRYDADLDDTKPLILAFDYNANINWCVVGQHDERTLKVMKSFYVKNNRKLRELCKDFDNYYNYRSNKDLIYYYDSTAIKSGYADEHAESFAEVIMNTLTKLGWNVKGVYMGNPIRHDNKHQYLDDAFKGIKYLFPMFNKYNNEELLQAIELTGIKQGKNGFEKDKSGEKLEETPEDPLELRTDGTDAFDTLFLGCCLFPQSNFNTFVTTQWGK
jgi:hypothetical protein